MGKEDCKESLNVYKKFTSQIDSVKKFFNVAEVCDEVKLRFP